MKNANVYSFYFLKKAENEKEKNAGTTITKNINITASKRYF
jgi:hypothetical protein